MPVSYAVPADAPILGRDPVDQARAHVAEGAFAEGRVGTVGLELEYHLVDLADPARRPTWAEVERLAVGLPPMPAESRVTLEPGGQIELSTPPADDVVASVAALRADQAVLRAGLADAGFGAAALGTDPARPVQRINPSHRYAAMETHFDALGCAGAGQQMMTATAALQVNVDAGPRAGQPQRLALLRALVPVLVAASATSPWLGGRRSGWHSMRQGVWQGIDHARTDPYSDGDPSSAWAFYALSAPVMLVRDPDPSSDALTPVTHRVSFAEWLLGRGPVDRRPTLADLDYHLSTLFPPIRPRGYVELRCLDAMPDRWWPAMAALVCTLLDDPVASDGAREACEPVATCWEAAARDGLAHAGVRRAVARCAALAADHAPAGLHAEVAALADLLTTGRTPGDDVRVRADTHGPLAVLEEEARA